ncbi:hypothetical protein T06_3726 [Trichinella sp. T6]|nr:hypothetical protein T06_3726 [Trichinella sp. T6]
MLVIIAEKPNLLVILDDMQECDYICAPPLMATNKLTDHESNILQYCMIITVNGDWKLEFFTAAIPDPEMLAEDFAICSNISNYNSTLPSENECMLSVLLCLAYNPFSPKKLLKEPYRCSFGEIVIPIKISLIKTDGVVIHRLSSENAIKSEFSTKLPTLVCMFAVDLQIQCNVVSA